MISEQRDAIFKHIQAILKKEARVLLIQVLDQNVIFDYPPQPNPLKLLPLTIAKSISYHCQKY